MLSNYLPPPQVIVFELSLTPSNYSFMLWEDLQQLVSTP